MTINGKTPNTEITIGEQVLEHTNTFKYLGMAIYNKDNMDDHIQKIKCKIEAALRMIFTLAENEELFHNTEMSTIWKLLETYILPIITHGAEAWNTTKADENALQKILDNIIKRILATPTTTPSELTTAETGMWDIETQRKHTMQSHNTPR